MLLHSSSCPSAVLLPILDFLNHPPQPDIFFAAIILLWQRAHSAYLVGSLLNSVTPNFHASPYMSVRSSSGPCWFGLPCLFSILLLMPYLPSYSHSHCYCHRRPLLNEFSNLSTVSPYVFLPGNFNIHLDKVLSPFFSLLDCYGFQQFSHFPTNIKGHTLDLTFCSGLTCSNCAATQLHVTDHFFLSFNVSLCLSISKTLLVISFGNIKNINKDSISSCIATFGPDSSSPVELTSVYNFGLSKISDKHPPATWTQNYSPLLLWTFFFMSFLLWSPSSFCYRRSHCSVQALHLASCSSPDCPGQILPPCSPPPHFSYYARFTVIQNCSISLKICNNQSHPQEAWFWSKQLQ